MQMLPSLPVKNGQVEIVHALLANGANVNNVKHVMVEMLSQRPVMRNKDMQRLSVIGTCRDWE